MTTAKKFTILRIENDAYIYAGERDVLYVTRKWVGKDSFRGVFSSESLVKFRGYWGAKFVTDKKHKRVHHSIRMYYSQLRLLWGLRLKDGEYTVASLSVDLESS